MFTLTLAIVYNYAMGIMDIIVIVFIALLGIIGLIKGGAKMFFGLFMLIVIAVGAAFAASAISPYILTKGKGVGRTYTSAATILMNPIGKALPSGGKMGECFDQTMTVTENGEVTLSGGSTLKEGMAGSIPYAGDIAASFVQPNAFDGSTVRNCIAYTITRYVYEAVIWLVLFIILIIIRNLIRRKIYAWLDNNSTPSAIDHFLGLIATIAFALVLLWGVLAILARLDNGGNWATKATEFMMNGKISNFVVYKINPFLKLMKLKLPVVK